MATYNQSTNSDTTLRTTENNMEETQSAMENMTLDQPNQDAQPAEQVRPDLFRKLPPELRIQVYEKFIFGDLEPRDDKTPRPVLNVSFKDNPAKGLLLASKQISQEYEAECRRKLTLHLKPYNATYFQPFFDADVQFNIEKLGTLDVVLPTSMFKTPQEFFDRAFTIALAPLLHLKLDVLNIKFHDDNVKDNWRTFRRRLEGFVKLLHKLSMRKLFDLRRFNEDPSSLKIPRKVMVREIRLWYYEEHARNKQETLQYEADTWPYGGDVEEDMDGLVCVYFQDLLQEGRSRYASKAAI